MIEPRKLNSDIDEQYLCSLLSNSLNKTGHFLNSDLYYVSRCPFCKDSRKHKVNHGHLYMYKGCTFFKCYRCEESGNIGKLFKEYLKNNIIDLETYNDIINAYNYLWGDVYTRKNKIYNTDDVMLKYTNSNVISGTKLSYISNRFNISHSDLYNNDLIHNYNIILDLEKFFNRNKYILYNKYKFIYDNESYINYLDNNYVGFLSRLKTKIILRKIDNNKNFKSKRYKVFSINSFFSDIDFYSYNELYSFYNTDTIIVAEGVFDIGNSKLDKYFDKNIPRLALLGKSRIKNLNRIVKSIKYEKYNHIIILLDKDLEKEKYHINKIIGNASYKISMYINKIGKDFGDKNFVLSKCKLNKRN